MRDLHLEIPTSIFVTGLITCLLSALGLFSPSTTLVLYEVPVQSCLRHQYGQINL